MAIQSSIDLINWGAISGKTLDQPTRLIKRITLTRTMQISDAVRDCVLWFCSTERVVNTRETKESSCSKRKSPAKTFNMVTMIIFAFPDMIKESEIESIMCRHGYSEPCVRVLLKGDSNHRICDTKLCSERRECKHRMTLMRLSPVTQDALVVHTWCLAL
mmetsp:Transcript_29053/g.98902  ORF Transcript_29053/g.98902 Transcript_29053/m.98902 type:complete len:160 (+) Transcript_29053:4815-5294(+)